MSCSLEFIVLTHSNYEPLKELSSKNQDYFYLYNSLAFLETPQGLDISVNFATTKKLSKLFSSLTLGMKLRSPQVNCKATVCMDKGDSLIDGLEVALQNSEADYVMFLMPGSLFSPSFLVDIFPYMEAKQSIIKAGVYDRTLTILQDDFYEALPAIYKNHICKDIGAYILRRDRLMEHDYIGRLKRFGCSEYGFCAGLMELVDVYQEEDNGDSSVDLSNVVSADKLEAMNAQMETILEKQKKEALITYEDDVEDRPWAEQHYINAKAEDIYNGRKSIVVCSVPKAKIYLKPEVFLVAEDVDLSIDKLVKMINNLKNFPLQYIVRSFFYYFFKYDKCDNLQVKMKHLQETCKLYQILVIAFNKYDQSGEIANNFDEYLDELSGEALAEILKNQDIFKLQRFHFNYKINSARRFTTNLVNDKSGFDFVMGEIKDRYKQMMPQGSVAEVLNWMGDASGDGSAAEAGEAQSKVPAENEANTNVSICSVVFDKASYQECFKNNPFLNKGQCTLYPYYFLTTEDLVAKGGLAWVYNEFLDKFDYSKPGWIVFIADNVYLHNDLSILETLDKNALYGIVGAECCSDNNGLCSSVIGYCIESSVQGKSYKLMGDDLNIYNLDMSSSGCEVSTLDNSCLIVHSSFIQQNNLRFDQNLKLDLVVEDFCLKAFEEYDIKPRVLKIVSERRSLRGYNHDPLSYYAALSYLDKKYHLKYAGTKSLFGAAIKDISRFNLYKKNLYY